MKKIVLLLVFFIVSFSFWETYGQNTFTGTGKSKKWSTPANWSAGLPVSGQDIVIATECNLDANIDAITFGSITINSGASLISTGTTSYLNLTGDFRCDGVFGSSSSVLDLYFEKDAIDAQRIYGTGTFYANSLQSDIPTLNAHNLTIEMPVNLNAPQKAIVPWAGLTLNVSVAQTGQINALNGFVALGSNGGNGSISNSGIINTNYIIVNSTSGNVTYTNNSTGVLNLNEIKFASGAGSGSFVNDGKLYLNGSNPLSVFNLTSNSFTSSGAIYFGASGDQNIANLPTSFGPIYFQGSGNKTLATVYDNSSNNIYVGGTANLLANANVTANALNVGNTASATLNNTTTLTSIVLGTSSTLNLNGTTAITNGLSASNSSIVNVGAIQSITPVSILGNAALNLNAVLNASSFTFGSSTPITNGANLNVNSLTYAGTSTITTGPELKDYIANLTINNAAGVTLTKNITVNGTLYFTQGNLNTGTYTVTLGNPTKGIKSNVTNEKNASHLIGRLKYTSISNSLLAGTYFGLVLPDPITATSGHVTITRTTGSERQGSGNSSILRYYDLEGTGLTYSGGNVSLTWFNTELNGKSMFSAIDFMLYDGATQWMFLNPTTGVNLGGNGQDSYTLTSTTPPAFTDKANVTLTASDAANPLPVELTSFTASVDKKGVTLNWETATEVSNHGFDIERALVSADGKTSDFAKLGFVNGNGNSNSPKSYSFVDNKAVYGKYVYRLKQIDTDGKFAYSKTTEANVNNLPTTFVMEQNYPNPFNPSTTIKFSVPKESFVNVAVYNMLGQKVATIVNETMKEGAYEKTFNASNLSSGNYVYVMTAGDSKIVKKMTLVK